MAKISATQIDQYLKRYGWTFHRGVEGCWITGWQGERHAFPLIIELSDTWLSMKVSPLMKLGLEWEVWPEVMRYVLELNHECKLAKLGIDEFGDLSISMQIFTEGLKYDQFCDSLGILGHYGERFFDELHRYLSAIGFQWQRPSGYLA